MWDGLLSILRAYPSHDRSLNAFARSAELQTRLDDNVVASACTEILPDGGEGVGLEGICWVALALGELERNLMRTQAGELLWFEVAIELAGELLGVVATDLEQSWLGEFGQGDRWRFCLTAAGMARAQERR
jgi:hypothetical protein